jgi:hypothetical protein
MLRLTGALTLALIAALPPAARAQAASSSSPSPLRDIAVSVSAGRASEVEDYFLTSPNWIGAVRFGLSTHLALEGEVGYWSGSTLNDYVTESPWDASNVRLTEPTGRCSTFALREWHAALSVIGRVPGHRVSWSGGGGLGVWTQAGETTFEEFSLTNPDHHREGSQDWNRVGVGAQGTVEVDVSITRRLQVFGAVRMEFVPQLDTRLFAVHGGVRWLF